jgi:hypothetical protein
MEGKNSARVTVSATFEQHFKQFLATQALVDADSHILRILIQPSQHFGAARYIFKTLARASVTKLITDLPYGGSKETLVPFL